MKDPTPDVIKCGKCGKDSGIEIHAPAVLTGGMSNAPIDVVVGRDAEARWADIKRRQELRNKVRQDSGEQAVRMTGRNEFTPIKGGRLETVAAPNSGEDKD
jgi:hypothetical protein